MICRYLFLNLHNIPEIQIVHGSITEVIHRLSTLMLVNIYSCSEKIGYRFRLIKIQSIMGVFSVCLVRRNMHSKHLFSQLQSMCVLHCPISVCPSSFAYGPIPRFREQTPLTDEQLVSG